jgi:lipopolysaccharide transport system ATP-binding protein
MTLTDVAISLHDFGKMYRVGHQRGPGTRAESYRTLREVMTDTTMGVIRAAIHGGSSQPTRFSEFWALRHLTFDIPEGEVCGIIGKNGAGKSTLLKLLSRITIPSEGYVDINGSVGSLLEVGIGFHPELSGRENIFIYGAILGLGGRFIEDHFDEIVSFSEIEDFIDTPVKRYSTGMSARLAFSVAATMDPDIMMLDEALSVGDTTYQKKAFAKMRDIARSGKTVLLVSHNMNSIHDFCDRVVWIEGGQVKMIGEPEEVIDAYGR